MISWPKAKLGIEILLSVAILVSLATTAWMLNTTKKSFSGTTRATEESVSLRFAPKTAALRLGQKVTVGILLSGTTGKSVSGVDILVRFDPSFWTTAETLLVPTSLFEQVLGNQIFPDRGIVKLSALTATPQEKNGIVASFTLTPVKDGETTITFLTPGTSVIEAKTLRNLLSTTDTATYTIQ